MLKGACLVTGAAGGLGRATAERLAKEGFKLVLLDKQGARLQTVAAELPEAIAVPGCIMSEEDVKRSLDAARDKFGRLDAVVNCAGLSEAHQTYNFHKGVPHSLEGFAKIINVNTIGTFNVIRLSAGLMAANSPDESGQRGVVVNTGSVIAYDGDIGHAAAAAAAAGIAGMTLPLARDLASGGIRVVTIAPGLFETPLLSYLPDKIVQFLTRMTPFPRRLGRPEEFAHLVHHVLQNRMINGEVIRLDGALRLFPL